MHEQMSDDAAPRQAERTETDEAEVAVVTTRGERISVGGGDENVAKLQLAARWAEQFTPEGDDSLEGILARFKRAYHYVDSVTKLVEPDPA
jgi:hypothetical protein